MDKGEGKNKSENFVDITYGSYSTPHATSLSRTLADSRTLVSLFRERESGPRNGPTDRSAADHFCDPSGGGGISVKDFWFLFRQPPGARRDLIANETRRKRPAVTKFPYMFKLAHM